MPEGITLIVLQEKYVQSGPEVSESRLPKLLRFYGLGTGAGMAHSRRLLISTLS